MPPKSDFVVMAIGVEGLLSSAMRFTWTRGKTGELSEYKFWRADDLCENIYKVTIKAMFKDHICSFICLVHYYSSS